MATPEVSTTLKGLLSNQMSRLCPTYTMGPRGDSFVRS